MLGCVRGPGLCLQLRVSMEEGVYAATFDILPPDFIRIEEVGYNDIETGEEAAPAQWQIAFGPGAGDEELRQLRILQSMHLIDYSCRYSQLGDFRITQQMDFVLRIRLTKGAYRWKCEDEVADSSAADE